MRRTVLPCTTGTLLLFFCVFLPAPGLAHSSTDSPPLTSTQAPEYLPKRSRPSSVDFSGWLKTYFTWRNDQDFDRTEPIFDEYGQSVGFIAVAFDPRVTWRPTQRVTVHYLADITGSLWSRTNVDPQLDQLKNQPVYLQKEFWTQVVWPNDEYGFRVGFQYFEDPTKLYLKKYVGALRTFYQTDRYWIALTAAQIPETTYEAIEYKKNNFENDNFVFSLDADYPAAGRRFGIRPGVFFQWDRSVVDKTQYLFTPSLNVRGRIGEDLTVECDLAMQAGNVKNTAPGNRDTSVLAGALQTRARLSLAKGYLEAGLVALSPDDADPYNGRDTSFRYSGYSKSRTYLLSENKLLDQYDNLDERAAASKSGWLLAEVAGGWQVRPSVELFNVLGYAMVFQKKYANGGQSVAMEYDAGLTWHLYEDLYATLVGGVLVPGRAGGAFTNELADLRARDPIFYFQGMVLVNF
jgi:hypothetical protein